MLRAPSIRARLLMGILLALVVILGTTAWLSYEVTKHEAEELFGARLATSARVLEALLAHQVQHATLANPLVVTLPAELEHVGDMGSALGHPYETKIAFQVWHDDGTLLARSQSASSRPFSPSVAGFSTQLVDGEPYQVFVLRSGSTWIQVAEKDEVRDELIHDLGIAVMTPLILGSVLLLILVNVLVMYGLAPLRQLAAHIAKREPESVGALELREVPNEVVPVVRELNDLLRRVRLAFERERRFTDAAAHELRTPIAALKIHADNMARAQTEAERSHSMARLKQGLDRTSNLAAQMLTYSRTQNVSEHEPRVAIRLADVVRETSASLEPVRQAKSQRLTLAESGQAESLRIMGEPTKIQRLILNLLDNASRYAPERNAIEVYIGADGGRVVLSVSNHGPVIPAELRERLFEPYYRAPGSASEGCGLGLAIVKEIALQHDASVRLSSITDTDGTIVSVSFPAFRASRHESPKAAAAVLP